MYDDIFKNNSFFLYLRDVGILTYIMFQNLIFIFFLKIVKQKL